MKASVPSSHSPVTEVVVLRRRVPTTTDRLVSIRPPAAEPASASPASEVRAVPAPAVPARTRVQMVVRRPVPARTVRPLAVPAARVAPADTRQAPTAQENADESLGRLTRLHERRAELLCLALLEPAASAVLDAIAAELDKGEAQIGSVVDEPELAPEEARRRFDALRADLDRLRREHGQAWPFAGVARLARSGPPSAFESALRASHAAAALRPWQLCFA